MNSYNENLHSSVVSSLDEQELELQKLKSQVNAATFSMYYAQGARISAEEKLEVATDKYQFQQKVHKKTITDSDLSTNVLNTAAILNTDVAKAVSDNAVAAANVQIAANAIVKLASDIGSVFSIVNAADYGTEIHNQAKMAYDLMNTTAYNAEKTSQLSMEASLLVSEVSAATVVNKATVADTSVKNLLTAVSLQLDAATTELTAETTHVAATNTAEKKTEGNLEDLNAEYHATKTAYTFANKELNLGLTVVLPDANKNFIGEETKYTVRFSPIKAPFDSSFLPQPESEENTKQYNPVANYYILLVKATKKSTFSISKAEDLVTKDDSHQYIKIPQQEFDAPSLIPTKITKTIGISDLLDTDNDQLNLGEEYVVFIFAELRTNYKKLLNTFDNYLSAASQKFTLVNQLHTADASSIQVSSNETTEKQTLAFTIWEKPKYKVAYRCMFLPNVSAIVPGLLTVEGLKTELLTSQYDKKHLQPGFYFDLLTAAQVPAGSYTIATDVEGSKINELSLRIIDIIDDMEALGLNTNILETLFNTLKDILATAVSGAKNDATIPELKNSINTLLTEKEKNFNGISKLTTSLEKLINDIINFLTDASSVDDLQLLLQDLSILENGFKYLCKGYACSRKQMTIQPETTDNFGNRLMNNLAYVPVVLSYSNVDSPTENIKFSNALSDFQATDKFVFKTTKDANFINFKN